MACSWPHPSLVRRAVGQGCILARDGLSDPGPVSDSHFPGEKTEHHVVASPLDDVFPVGLSVVG